MASLKERIVLATSSVVAAIALVGVFAFGVTKSYRNQANANTKAAMLTLNEVPTSLPEQKVSPVELSNTFRQVAKLMRPAVVNISTVQKVTASRNGRGGFPFDFPGLEPDPGQGGAPQEFKQRGNGSGVIVSADGYILTNNHVVGKANSIEVKLADGRKFKGKVVGTDQLTDLAVVKIDANNLQAASLGDSEGMEQGDWVVAVGSPFGLEQTLTAGIVSAKGRYVSNNFSNYIQTDASINPGNSGGPLVNMRGQVIGINTLIFTETGANQGIGFAVPSNLARNVYNQLVAKGKVVRGYLGVSITELAPEQAKALGFSTTEGAFVNDVSPNTPAAKAGIKSGDLIISFDGKPVKDQYALTSVVAETPVGKRVEVKFIREGKVQTIAIETAERNIDNASNNERVPLDGLAPEENQRVNSEKLGFSASSLSAEQLAALKIKSGVVVERVSPSGLAAEAGLRPNDVIHQINRQAIKSVADLNAITRSLKEGDVVVIQVERNGTLSFFTITLE
jgi:serine protease Do